MGRFNVWNLEYMEWKIHTLERDIDRLKDENDRLKTQVDHLQFCITQELEPRIREEQRRYDN